MLPKLIKANSLKETLTSEGCFLYENCGKSIGDNKLSIARARVEPGITTKAHRLEGIKEIYLIVNGKGIVNIEGLEPTEVEKGDVVIIPPEKSQRIRNTGKSDLVFYCICTPSFSQDRYYEGKVNKPQ